MATAQFVDDPCEEDAGPVHGSGGFGGWQAGRSGRGGDGADAAGAETWMVGRGDGAVARAEVAGFAKGEHLLGIIIFAGAEAEEVEVEIAQEGSDSVVTANGRVLAVLRGVPDLDFDDLDVEVQAADARSAQGSGTTS